jgi:hypothetical protein
MRHTTSVLGNKTTYVQIPIRIVQLDDLCNFFGTVKFKIDLSDQSAEVSEELIALSMKARQSLITAMG